MLVSSQDCKATHGCLNEDFMTPLVAGVMTGFGGIFATIGIPLYVAGSKRAAAVLQPQAMGFALRF